MYLPKSVISFKLVISALRHLLRVGHVLLGAKIAVRLRIEAQIWTALLQARY